MSVVMAPPHEVAPPQPAEPDRRPGRFAAWLVRWRLALRLARRDARRAKGRTALVLLMVGLPVAAIVGGDTLYRSNDVTASEAIPPRLGSADALIEGVSRDRIWADPVWGEPLDVTEPADPPWTREQIAAALPAGSEVVERQVGRITFRTDIGYATADGYADDLTNDLRDGAFITTDGRVPVADGEVAVSSAVARRGYEVGDRIELTRDDVAMTVVGVVRSDFPMGSASFVVLPTEAGDLLSSARSQFFADVPGSLDWPAVQQLNGLGLAVVSAEVAADPPPPAEYVPPGYPTDGGMDRAQLAVLALIVAALLLEVVLLAGPAFAVGLRRQRRDLALLAASGGSPADLRRAVLASGVVLGGAAAVLGAVLGIAGARAAVPLLERYVGASFGPLDVPVLDVLAVVGVGVVAGLAAAYVPARQAARTDVVTTLTGRRGQVRTSWRLPVLGLLVAAAGLALSVLGAQGTELAVSGGAVLLIVGLVLTTPWLVGLLAPLARRLPVAGRLAVRDATRNRSRTAPAVAAVMATVAGVTTLAIASASDSAQGERDYVQQAPMGAALVHVFDADDQGWGTVRAAAEEQVPGRSVHEVRAVRWSEDEMLGLWVTTPACARPVAECMWFPGGVQGFSTTLGEVVVVDVGTLAAVTPPEIRDDVLAAYRSDRAVVFGQGGLDDSGEVTLQATRWDGTAEQPVGSTSLPAVEVVPRIGDGMMMTAPALVVVPPSLAERLPVEMAISRLIVGGPDEPVTGAEETRLTEAIAALSSESSVYVERGWTDALWVVRLLLVIVGGILVLVATLTATGLAVADARPDLATLAAIGAASRTRRLMAMGSAAVIGVFGAVLGVLAGLAPGIAVAHPLTTEFYGSGRDAMVVIPWDLLAAVAIGVPLLAVLVTGLAVRSRLPMVTRIAG